MKGKSLNQLTIERAHTQTQNNQATTSVIT